MNTMLPDTFAFDVTCDHGVALISECEDCEARDEALDYEPTVDDAFWAKVDREMEAWKDGF